MRVVSCGRRALAASALLALAAGIASGVGGGAPQQATLAASDGMSGDRFGLTVAVAGDTAVVGAPQKDNVRGAAYVFTRAGTVWAQEAKLTASDAVNGDAFGTSVAIAGDTALVGASERSLGRGAVYVFTRTGATWTQEAKLTASDAATGDKFGVSVAVSGDTAVVGAHNVGTLVGAAYVFTRTGTAWTQQAKLAAADGLVGDVFGSSVAVSGDTAVIGAYGTGTQVGAAYVFTRTGTAWTQQAKLTAADPANNDAFGASVAVEGDTVVAGAAGKDSDRGAAYVFTRTGAAWAQTAKLRAADTVVDDGFGASVSLSGGTIVAGAYSKDASRGVAYAFRRTGSRWAQVAKFAAADAADGDRFGSTVALAGDTAVAGAFWKGGFRGAAYVFALPPGDGTVSGYVLPAKIRARANAAAPAKSTLTASGTIDTGSGLADFSGAATFDAGGFHVDVPAFVAKGRSLSFTDGVATLKVTPARNGSSRAAFSVKFVGDLVGNVGVDRSLALSFANAAHDVGGTATLTAGVLVPHGVSAPILAVVAAKATIKGGGRDTLKLTLGFAGDGAVPAVAEDLTVGFGATFTSGLLPAASFVKKGNAWVRTAKGPGLTKATIDYAKGTITIVGSGLDLGAFAAGGNAVVVTVTRGSDTRAVAVRMGLAGTKLSY